MSVRDVVIIRLSALNDRQVKFWDENYNRSSCSVTKTVKRIINIAMDEYMEDSNEIETVPLKIVDKKERISFRLSALDDRQANFWDENYNRSSCSVTKTVRRIINIAMKLEKKRKEKKTKESKDIEKERIIKTSVIHSNKITQTKEIKSQRYKLQYPRYDFQNMLTRIDKEEGFRKAIEKALYKEYLWTQSNIDDFREYINNIRKNLKDKLNENLIQAFITIDKLLDLKERAIFVIGRPLVYGGISIADTNIYSKRIYGRYCYEKLFKEYGIPLPDALEHCRDEKIDNIEQLKQSNIYEDLIKIILDKIGLESEIQESINDYRAGNLDHEGKTRLMSKILTNDDYYSNPYYQKILEEIKKERAN